VPDSASTRQALVTAAQELVVEGGWEMVTTRRVAERAAVSPGLVHYHVGSIEALRRTAAYEGARDLLDGPFQAAMEAPDLREGLTSFLLQLNVGPAHPGAALLNEALIAATHDAALRRDLAAMFSAFRARLAERLRVRTDSTTADAQAKALALVAAVDGFLLQRALDPDLDAEQLVRGIAPLLEPR